MADEEKTFWCRGCDGEFALDKGRAIDGYTVTVCKECWGTMSPFQRVLLHMLSTTGFDSDNGGGLGIAFELNELNEMQRKRFRAEHGHDPDVPCRECDPLAHEERMRRKAAAAKSAKGQ